MTLRTYQTALINAARNSFRHGHRSVLIVAPCGAGKTVLAAFMASAHPGRVLFLAHRRELTEQAAETFDAAGLGRDNIAIMSVQTAARRVGRIDSPTLIILDEAHHAAAKTWRTVLDGFPDAHVVGLTATPCRLDGKGLGDVFDDLVQTVTTGWLVKHKYLAPYRYLAPKLADASGLRRVAGDFSRAEAEALMDAPKIIGDAVQHYRTLADGKQAIVYCATIRHSMHMAEAFSSAGIHAEHLDGDTPGTLRADIVKRFRSGETRVLTNVDLLGEGFDVPACDAVILLRPTQSTALFVQQAMRSMRYVPGKTALIIDHVGNCERHGFPDDERGWALEMSRSKKRDAPAARFATCEKCFAVYTPPPFSCPYCGAEAPETVRRELEQAEGELVELTDEMKAAIRRKLRKEEGMARSYEDFKRIGKERGYKPGWAWIRARKRGFV